MNAVAIVQAALLLAALYGIMGLLFALPFAFFFVSRLDPAAKGGTYGFRLLIIPGATLLWPMLLSRLLRKQGVPEECTAHRSCGLQVPGAKAKAAVVRPAQEKHND